MRKFLLAAMCALGLVAALPAGALANPTIVLEERCTRAGDGTGTSSGVAVAVTGLEPNSEVTGSLAYSGDGFSGGVGPLTLRADGSGVLNAGSFGIAVTGPVVFTVRIFGPVVLERTITVTCQSRPTYVKQCKEGGWRQFGIFKNQGDCVSFVVTEGRNPPAGAPA